MNFIRMETILVLTTSFMLIVSSLESPDETCEVPV